MAAEYDVIVVGGGVEGSSTAYNLVKQGKRTLLIEQFPLPHTRGSSHGKSRITRKAYGASDFYTVMMHESYKMIEELERETGDQLYQRYGMIMMGPADDPSISASINVMKKNNIPYQELSAATVMRKYPLMSYPERWRYVLEADAGVLVADRILRGFQSQFQKHGGVIRDEETMLDLVPGSTVTVKTNKGEYRAKAVVIVPGPWAPVVLPKLGINVPLEVIRTTACYWKPKDGYHGNIDIPAFLSQSGTGRFDVYGMPSEYPGLVKICLHDGPKTNPESRDSVDASWVLERIGEYIREFYPTLDPVPCITEPCIYTLTPDDNFYIDYHPRWRNVVIAAGFSGHGFKLSPVVGKVLSEMAMGKTPSYTIEPFRLDRFQKTTSKL